MGNYFYPDTEDVLTSKLITSPKYTSNYWAKSEKAVLSHVHECIQKMALEKELAFLDAGCGEGRLTLEFAPYFSTVHSIDPDLSRLKTAQQLLATNLPHKPINFKNIDIQSADIPIKFDIILCSHILQHVRIADIPVILSKLTSMLALKGLLCITTCNSTEKEDTFTKSELANDSLVEEKITREEFDSLVCNSKGVLPVHSFTKCNFTTLLEDCGLDSLTFKCFHVEEKFSLLDKLISKDIVINSCDFLQRRYGRDFLCIAKKSL